MEQLTKIQFYSPEIVAQILDVSLDDVYSLINSGELLALRVGVHGPWRIDKAHLEHFIADGYSQAHRSREWNQGTYANVFDLADGRLL